MKVIFIALSAVLCAFLGNDNSQKSLAIHSQEFTISFNLYGTEYYLNGRIKHLDVTMEDSPLPAGTRWVCETWRESGNFIFRIKNRTHYLNGRTCSDGKLTLETDISNKGVRWKYHEIGYNKFKLECLGKCALRWVSANKNGVTLVSDIGEATVFTIPNHPFNEEIKKWYVWAKENPEQSGYKDTSPTSNGKSFRNSIICDGACGFANGGCVEYISNSDSGRSYNVTVKTFWSKGIESGEREDVFTVSAGGKTRLGCTDSGALPETSYRREIVGEEAL